MAEKKSIEKCFQILGLELSASLDDVKSAHRFLVQTFHEDKYPADSPMRAKAKEKMIELNDAYERLKNFFEENPEGYKRKSAGRDGLNGVGDRHRDRYGDEEAGADGGEEMDWQAWQSQQETRAAGAIEEWQAEEQERRAAVKLDEERTQRKHCVNFGMIGAWLVLGLMWIGHYGTGVEHRYTDMSRVEYFKDALAYKIQMGTATTGDVERLNQSKDRWNVDAEKNNGSMVVLVTMLLGMSYVSLFPKPKRLIANWIETGSLSEQGALQGEASVAA
ncbi:MAG: J domain-containing protein [Candidatus Melainabacteria bacterium]|nr:MAG: J domain-containing protein [Candidatus Melainabacteria bacterium]